MYKLNIHSFLYPIWYNHICTGGINMLEKFKIDKKLLKQLDYSLILIVISIVLFGCVNIYSATQNSKINIHNFHSLKLQLMWLVVGLIVVYIILTIDYSVIANYAGLIYWANVGLLVFTQITAKAIKGSSNWIKIGSISIQPSEFAKIAMIIMLAKKLDDMDGEINNPKNFFTLVMYAIIPMLLIVIAPDMGMTMICFFMVFGIFFVSGLNLKVITAGISAIVGVIIVFLNLNLPLKYEYMKRRIISFIKPDADPATAYQRIQSIIGIGSGGILGNGFLKGSQIRGRYIPEPSTDFIFAVIGEEWGFVGAVFLLSLYGILIYKYINIAKNSKDIFGSVICIGIVSGFMFSIIQNIGMTIGIVPISGITLPFVSYGGSSMLANFIALGLVLNVGMRKKKINF